MYLGKVIGTVVATRKYEGLEGKKKLTPHDALDKLQDAKKTRIETMKESNRKCDSYL